MDDVTFGRNGRDAERWRLTRAATAMNGVEIPGRSLMSMNACSFLSYLGASESDHSEIWRFINMYIQ